MKIDIIGITVSTKYSDILPYVIKANKKFLKHWIFITDKNDKKTINILKKYKTITILYFDFQEDDRIFNKGGGIRLGQEFAYKHFPDDWYLILDSDICLEKNFKKYINCYAPVLDPKTIYGCKKRRDFHTYKDYKYKINFIKAGVGYTLPGFFQFYKRRIFYQSSNDASTCDMQFLTRFKSRIYLNEIICYHLGKGSIHWEGRKTTSDFKI
jgi:hypothetical protein